MSKPDCMGIDIPADADGAISDANMALCLRSVERAAAKHGLGLTNRRDEWRDCRDGRFLMIRFDTVPLSD